MKRAARVPMLPGPGPGPGPVPASVLGLALALGLASCTGALFKSKAAPPTIYMLSDTAAEPVSPVSAGAMIPVDLAVLKPRVRTGLETDRIAILYPDRRLDYFANARWSGPLSEVVQDLAVQAFHSRANLRTVSGDSSVFASGFWVEIEVTDFQAEYSSTAAPTVHVHLEARIGRSSDRGILGRFEADARQRAAENRLSAIVAAYALASKDALADIVARGAAVLEKTSEVR